MKLFSRNHLHRTGKRLIGPLFHLFERQWFVSRGYAFINSLGQLEALVQGKPEHFFLESGESHYDEKLPGNLSRCESHLVVVPGGAGGWIGPGTGGGCGALQALSVNAARRPVMSAIFFTTKINARK